MNFIGIDAHANRFTCCYRDERRSDRPEDRVMKTFDLNAERLAAFYATLTEDTYVLTVFYNYFRAIARPHNWRSILRVRESTVRQ